VNKEDNERLTCVGPGTPMGETMRRYWLPALLCDEVAEPEGPPVRVRLLGGDLIAFRATDGKVGLVSAFCPHRRAPMFFGRNEECGLRCVYHGWKFDVDGTCVDMPSEPPDSLFKSKVRIEAYPTWEGGGIVWTYLGPRETMPAPPAYEFTRAPRTHQFTSKTYQECNYLQALDGGVDTAHSSFLHNDKLGDRGLIRNRDGAPRIEVDRKPWGYTYASLRDMGDGRSYVRVYQYAMPVQQMRAFTVTMTGEAAATPKFDGHLWVPIDDTHTWSYNWACSFDERVPLSEEFAVAWETYSGRGPDDVADRFYPVRNPHNDYLIDRALQKASSYTGIIGANTQDMSVQEGMGPISDRTGEHLGTIDRAIIALRQLLLEATKDVEAGRAPRGSDPASFRDARPWDGFIGRGADWRDAFAGKLVATW
jgi:phenylpropionate dioxygenase-like ring-hydroxylating dioxygenase large terminal subunit